MSLRPLPPLRKPKEVEKTNIVKTKEEFIIITLDNSVKLAMSSDSYHCVILIGNEYKCVLCNVSIDLSYDEKEKHKLSHGHQTCLKVSFVEDYGENLIRQIDRGNCYCTVCNVVTAAYYLNHHVNTEAHVAMLNRALARASIY